LIGHFRASTHRRYNFLVACFSCELIFVSLALPDAACLPSYYFSCLMPAGEMIYSIGNGTVLLSLENSELGMGRWFRISSRSDLHFSMNDWAAIPSLRCCRHRPCPSQGPGYRRAIFLTAYHFNRQYACGAFCSLLIVGHASNSAKRRREPSASLRGMK
jgi:hypothetical protein